MTSILHFTTMKSSVSGTFFSITNVHALGSSTTQDTATHTDTMCVVARLVTNEELVQRVVWIATYVAEFFCFVSALEEKFTLGAKSKCDHSWLRWLAWRWLDAFYNNVQQSAFARIDWPRIAPWIRVWALKPRCGTFVLHYKPFWGHFRNLFQRSRVAKMKNRPPTNTIDL